MELRWKGYPKQAGSAIFLQILPKPADVEFLIHICFLQLVEIYKVLKYIIKFVDIGLLSYILPYIYIYFISGWNKNYLLKILYFF